MRSGHIAHILLPHPLASAVRSLLEVGFPRSRAIEPAYRWSGHCLRQWDYSAAQKPDRLIANSRYIQQRIKKYYHRDSDVIYPPVDTCRGYVSDRYDDYYLSVGRLVHAKRLDILIEACNRLKRRLVIAGEGREEKRLKAIAGPTVEFLGRVSDDCLHGLYAHCRALLFAADEDFGIVPVEAQSYGRPIIAYGHGGSLETVRVADHRGRSDTGVFFPHQTAESVVEGIEEFEMREEEFSPHDIRYHACMFDTSVFVGKMRDLVGVLTEERTRPTTRTAGKPPEFSEACKYLGIVRHPVVLGSMYGFSFEHSAGNTMAGSKTQGLTAGSSEESEVIRIQNAGMYLLCAILMFPLIKHIGAEFRRDILISALLLWMLGSGPLSSNDVSASITNGVRMVADVALAVDLLRPYNTQ